VRETADPNTRKPWVEAVSWHPRAFVYHNFLSHEECDHIVNVSKPLVRCCLHATSGLPPHLPCKVITHEMLYVTILVSAQMRRSTVVGAEGESVTDNIRTSYGTFLRWAGARCLLQ